MAHCGDDLCGVEWPECDYCRYMDANVPEAVKEARRRKALEQQAVREAESQRRISAAMRALSMGASGADLAAE